MDMKFLSAAEENQQDNIEDQSASMRCNTLEIPMINPETLQPLVTLFFEELTEEQWGMLAAGNIDFAIVSLLGDLCMEIIQLISTSVLNAIVPVVYRCIHGNICPTSHRGSFLSVTEEQIHTSLGDALQQCFSKALEVQQQSSTDSEKLTQLVGKEVAQKVNSVLSVAIQTSVLDSEEPAFFVSGCISCIPVLHNMVLNVIAILRRCLVQMKTRYTRRMCWQPKSEDTASVISVNQEQERVHVAPSCEALAVSEDSCWRSASPLNPKIMEKLASDSFVTTVTKAVRDILLKQASKSNVTLGSAAVTTAADLEATSGASLCAQAAASDIVQMIVQGLQSDAQISASGPQETTTGSQQKRNRLFRFSNRMLNLVATKLRTFFALQSRPSQEIALSDREGCSRNFSKFSKDYIIRMVEKLKGKCGMPHRHCRNAIVTVDFKSSGSNRSVSPQSSTSTHEGSESSWNSWDFMPGSVFEATPSQTPSEFSAPISRSVLSDMTHVSDSCSGNMNAVIADVDRLLEEMSDAEEWEIQSDVSSGNFLMDTLRSVGLSSDESNSLIRKITNRLYTLVMTGKAFRIPKMPGRKSLSDTVAVKLIKRGATTHPHLFYEFLYEITEDEFMRFLQKQSYWFASTRSSHLTSYSDRNIHYSDVASDVHGRVSDTLNDVEQLFDRMMTILENEMFLRQKDLARGIQESHPEVSDLDGAESGRQSGHCNGAASDDLAASESTLSKTDEKISCFVTMLLVRLLTRTAETSLSQVDFDGMIKHLSEKTVAEMNGSDSIASPKKLSSKKISKAVFSDLCEQFGSAEALQAAMTSRDPAFDDAVVKALTTHLQIAAASRADSSKTEGKIFSFLRGLSKLCCKSRKAGKSNRVSVSNSEPANTESVKSPLPSKKSKHPVTRFLSSVARAFTKPFTACFNGDS